MRKALLGCAALVLVFVVSCKCTVERQAVSQVDESHKIIATQLLKYVAADPKLDAKAKDDWVKLVESNKRNIDALKKALEN